MPCSRCLFCGRWRIALKEAPQRAWRTVFVMIVLLVSWLASTFPLLVAIADVSLPCVLFRVANHCPSCLPSPVGWDSYAFKSSMADVFIVAVLRSLAAVCAYFICGMSSLCHGPYLVTTVASGAISFLFVAIKASLFTYAGRGPFLPGGETASWFPPVMFVYSMMFAALHILVAYQEVFSARRKLRLQRLDDDISGQMSSDYWKLPLTPGSARSKKQSFDGEGKPSVDENDDEKDLPPHMLADPDSEFMDCEGVAVHFKMIGVGSPHSVLSPNRHGGSMLSRTSTMSSSNSLSSAEYSVSGSKSSSSLTGPKRTSVTPLMIMPRYFNPGDGRLDDSDGGLHQPLLKASTGKGTALYSTVYGGEDRDLDHLVVSLAGTEARRKWADDVGVVLLHGFGGGVFSWRNVMPLLSVQLGCTIVAFDRPGFGLTSRPTRTEWEKSSRPNPYKLESQVDLLMHFCKSVGLRSVVLVGHADGGLLALMAAAAAKEGLSGNNMVEVKGLVLLNTSLVQGVMPTFARVLLQTSLGRRMLRPLLRSEIGEVANRRAWYDARKLTPEVLKHYKVPLRVEGWDNALAEVGRLPAYGDKASTAAMLKSASSLPVLVVAGENDQVVSSKQVSVLAAELPLSRLLIIDECGHLPHEECPGAVLAAMVPFVRKVLENMGGGQSGIGIV